MRYLYGADNARILIDEHETAARLQTGEWFLSPSDVNKPQVLTEVPQVLAIQDAEPFSKPKTIKLVKKK